MARLQSRDPSQLRAPGSFGDTMRNVVNRVEPGHVLFLQDVNSVALALREHGDENVRAGYLLAARGLDMNRRALQHALEARRRLRVVTVGGDEIADLVIDIVQDLAAQPLEVDAAGAQHSDRVLILGQRKQQMLGRGIFVLALVGIGGEPDAATFLDCGTTCSPTFS